MEYGSYNVNEKYSGIVAPNLYYDSVLQPGITYNTEFQGDADSGLVKIYKLHADGIGDPQAPASDFNHEGVENELIDLRLNNSQRKSKKIYKIQAQSVPYAMAEKHLSNAVTDAKLGWQASGIACLVNEGKASTDTTAITKSNIEDIIINTRKEAIDGLSNPSVVMATTATYATMLKAAGSAFTPTLNDKMRQSGKVGIWLGMLWVECNMFGLPSAKYYNYAGDLKTVDFANIDFAMYDYRALNIVDNLEEIRVIDSENFVGSLAQVEINTGYRVTNQDMVLVKKTA